MRKLLAILFICLSATTTELPELLKMPILLQHYYAHISEGRSENFLGFFNEHYILGDGDEQDRGQDEELPFKTIHVEHLTSTYILEQSPDLKMPEHKTLNQPFSPYNSFVRSDLLDGIFRPPRIA